MLVSRPVAFLVGTLSRHRIRNYDLTFETSNPAISPKVEAQLFWRLYEGAEIRMAREHLVGTETLIDLGSSLGFTAAHVLARMPSTGRLIAVEANPSLIPVLRENLTTHACGREVRVIHAAIHYGPDTRAHLVVGGSTVGSRLGTEGVEVPVTTLSDIVSVHDVGTFALLSDIEGAEAALILDDPALSRCTKMVIELHATTYQREDISVGRLHAALLARGFVTLSQRGPVFAMERRASPL